MSRPFCDLARPMRLIQLAGNPLPIAVVVLAIAAAFAAPSPSLSAAPGLPIGKAVRFQAPLPITGTVDTDLQSRIERTLASLPAGGERLTIVLEFSPSDKSLDPAAAGAGSDFGRSLSLANFLSSSALSSVRTVAYLPQNVRGHAVLPVLACEQIVMASEAELGPAGDSEAPSPTVREAYRDIASRRRAAPPAVAVGMADPKLSVTKATTQAGVQFVDLAELDKLRAAGEVLQEEALFQPQEPHSLTGKQMRQLGFASHVADDHAALAAALDLPPRELEQSLAPETGWKPIRVDLDGIVKQQQVNWIIRSVEERRRSGDFNLLILFINSPGGNPSESLRLAQYLAALPSDIHCVALVGHQALGDASLVALACDDLLIKEQAKVGGPGEANLSARRLKALREPIAQTMRDQGRDWSLPLALLDPSVAVYEYSRNGGQDRRWLSEAELPSVKGLEDWQRAATPLDLSQGLSGAQLDAMGLGRAVQSLDEFRTQYQLQGEVKPLEGNWALALVEWLSDPWIAGALLFFAIFALIFEFAQPGVSAPAFVSALCFMLYFWSQFLHGTAGWLEVLLFVGGVFFVGIELFALPGFGIFGIGGGIMMIVSIVLASQTFVLPGNAYQMSQFPVSLLVLGCGLTGGMAAVFVVRRFLPDTPYFNRMLLKPPDGEEREELQRREALVSWGHLAGKTGITLTPLVPSGKAQFGDELIDVVSDGDLIDRGATVCIAEVLGNRVVVKLAPGHAR